MSRDRTAGQPVAATPELDDAALVEAAAGGDAEAFRALYDRYAPAVYNAALRILGSAAGAADATQDAFVALLSRFEQLEDPARVGAWLLRTVSRKAIDVWRKQRRDPESLDLPANRLAALERADRGPTPLHEVLVREEEQELARRLLALPEGFREVVVLRYVEGLSYEEISRILEIELGTVKSRIHRAHLMLAE